MIIIIIEVKTLIKYELELLVASTLLDIRQFFNFPISVVQKLWDGLWLKKISFSLVIEEAMKLCNRYYVWIKNFICEYEFPFSECTSIIEEVLITKSCHITKCNNNDQVFKFIEMYSFTEIDNVKNKTLTKIIEVRGNFQSW